MYRVLVLLRIDGDRKKPIEQWMSLDNTNTIRYHRDEKIATKFLTFDRAMECVELTQHDIDTGARYPEKHNVMIEQYINFAKGGTKDTRWIACFSNIQGAVNELIDL